MKKMNPAAVWLGMSCIAVGVSCALVGVVVGAPEGGAAAPDIAPGVALPEAGEGAEPNAAENATDKQDRVDISAFNRADIVLVARVTEVRPLMATMSMPPTTFFQITLEKPTALRGTSPAKLSFRQSVKGSAAPGAVGDEMIVALEVPPAEKENPDDTPIVRQMLLTKSPASQAAREAATLPIGWQRIGKELVSPWAPLEKSAWPDGIKVDAPLHCDRTGRPALVAPAGIVLTSEKVMPKKLLEYKNPYGDGEFRLTLTNTTKEDSIIPALLTDGKTIFWADALIAFADNEPYLLPAAGHLTAECHPVALKAGESISYTINTLTLPKHDWPQGGSRVYFQFALGNLSARDFFYFFTDYHQRLIPKK